MSEITIPDGAFVKAGEPKPEAKAPEVKALSNDAKPKLPDPELKPLPQEPEEAPEGMTKAEKKIWKLKADGEEFEFDASDEEAIKREIMKARGSNKRFESAALMRKQAETFFEMLKDKSQANKFRTDPNIGPHFMELAKEAVWAEMNEAEEKRKLAEMTPEQREAYEDQKELEDLRRERDSKKEATKTQEKQAEQQYFEAEYEKKIMSALELKGVPKNAKVVSEMAYYIEKAIEHNHDLSPEDIAELVKNDMTKGFKSYVDDLDDEQFAQFLGENNIAKLRRRDLKRVKTPQDHPFQKRGDAPKRDGHSSKPKKMVASDWSQELIKGFLAR